MNRPAVFATCCAMLALAIGPAGLASAEEGKLSVEKLLRAESFYDTSADRDFTLAQIDEIEQLAADSKDPQLRIRAQKVIVDRLGRGRASDPRAVAASFKYLESKFDLAEVKKLCLEQGFSHYTVSMRGDKSVWFLIEFVKLRGFNGGLNLEYDPQTGQIAHMDAWGDVLAAK